MDKKTLIIAQLIMTFMMALMMSGIMLGIGMGFRAEWLRHWPPQFLIAWPIAFALTQLVSRVAFPLAIRLRRFV